MRGSGPIAGMLCGIALAGCGAGLADAADRAAQREMPCAIPGRRVVPVGHLVVAPRAPLEIALYEASGCEQERLYLCVDDHGAHCEHDIAQLPQPAPDSHAAIARALHLLRTASRARCPAAEITVVQESESLFHFHACDGNWLYHCRARGCDRL